MVTSGANFALTLQVSNLNAYKINAWKLKTTLNGSQTVTNVSNGSYTQNGDVVTFTNSTAQDNQRVRWCRHHSDDGTYTGTNTIPTSFELDTDYTPSHCTVV